MLTLRLFDVSTSHRRLRYYKLVRSKAITKYKQVKSDFVGSRRISNVYWLKFAVVAETVIDAPSNRIRNTCTTKLNMFSPNIIQVRQVLSEIELLMVLLKKYILKLLN